MKILIIYNRLLYMYWLRNIWLNDHILPIILRVCEDLRGRLYVYFSIFRHSTMVEKKIVKKLSYSYDEGRAWLYDPSAMLLSHVKHYFMVRLPKQNRLRAHILRVKFLDLNIHATLDQTHSAPRAHRLHRD